MLLDVTDYILHSPRLPAACDGLVLCQVSDLHNRACGDKLLPVIKKRKPDAIVLTGDLIARDSRQVDHTLRLVHQLCQLGPVYYAPGNHEPHAPMYPTVRQAALQAGVTLLEDAAVWLPSHAAPYQGLRLIGVVDPAVAYTKKTPMTPQNYADLLQRIRSLIDPQAFNLVLSHRPVVQEVYQHCGADVVLSGHAHGGQWRLPVIGGLYAPQQGLFPRYTAGVHRRGDTQVVISRGLGNSGFPLRLFNNPELVFITLRREEK